MMAYLAKFAMDHSVSLENIIALSVRHNSDGNHNIAFWRCSIAASAAPRPRAFVLKHRRE